jgi:hypothetical protein
MTGSQSQYESNVNGSTIATTPRQMTTTIPNTIVQYRQVAVSASVPLKELLPGALEEDV